MLAELRQARYGHLLALHILLLCARGRTPTEIAAVLFCSRSSVYRRGTQTEVLTPGTNRKHYLAGALDILTGKIMPVVGERKNRWLFIDLLKLLERKFPAPEISKLYVVADNYRIHKAQAVIEWLARHPRFEIIWLPSYCPKANPIERAFGDVPGHLHAQS